MERAYTNFGYYFGKLGKSAIGLEKYISPSRLQGTFIATPTSVKKALTFIR
jgi:hypothetical protein